MSEDPPPEFHGMLPLVYEELRRLAAARMARERPGYTLQPTELVHEAWLRVGGDGKETAWKNRAHFFAAAAEAMRRILIDRARHRSSLRHGGNQPPLNIDNIELTLTQCDNRLLELDGALNRLAEVHPDHARLVKLRYFAGMTLAEAAEAMDISEATAKRRWTFARAWLYREIRGPDR